jgi:hypothetical protein
MGQVSFKPPQTRAVSTTFDPATLAGTLFWGRSKALTAGTITSWPNLASTGVTATSSGTVATAALTPSSGQAVRCTTAAISFNHIGGIYATSEFNGTYFAGNLIDGDSATSWASTGYTSQTIIQELQTAAAATAYTMAAEGSAVARAPSAWTFAGSNDASSWTTLDTRSGVTFTGTTAQQFTFTNTTAYKFYRLAPTVTPTGSGEIWLSRFTVDSVTLLGAAREIWRVIKSNDTSGQAAQLGASGQSSHYTFGGVVYDDSFCLSRQSFTSTLAVTSWRIYRVVNDAGTWKADVDNVNQSTATSKPLSMNASPKIATSWSGDIAEVFVRDRASTAPEIANLISYFNAEHGLTADPVTVADVTGGTMSASSTYGTAAASRAQDGNLGSEWMADNVIPCWLKVVYGASKTVHQYRISPMTGQETRGPATWTFDGSNDGTSWTTLDTQTAVPTWTGGETRVYTLAADATYTQFRLNITAKQAAGDGYINLSEFWVREVT